MEIDELKLLCPKIVCNSKLFNKYFCSNRWCQLSAELRFVRVTTHSIVGQVQRDRRLQMQPIIFDEIPLCAIVSVSINIDYPLNFSRRSENDKTFLNCSGTDHILARHFLLLSLIRSFVRIQSNGNIYPYWSALNWIQRWSRRGALLYWMNEHEKNEKTRTNVCIDRKQQAIAILMLLNRCTYTYT